MRRMVYVCAMMATWVVGCARPIRSGDLIHRYRAAQCIPVAAASKSSPYRSWNYKTTTRAGDEILVEGFHGPGGVVTVTFGPNPQPEVAARPGDYIYPVEVRIDPAHEHLYIKAHGRRAWTIRPTTETLLFEYDLGQRKQTNRQLVDPAVVTPECPETSASTRIL